MPLRLNQIKCPPDYTEEIFLEKVKKSLDQTAEGKKYLRQMNYGRNVPVTIKDIVVIKKSLDARKKTDVCYVFTVDVYINESVPPYLSSSLLRKQKNVSAENKKIVVAGTGPAGIFAALTLATEGYRPVIIERGKKIPERVADTVKHWETGIPDEESNVQFGEGGAGTFSDGKLTTGIKSPHIRTVLETFADAGAPQEILFLAKPHIGTDLLRNTVIKLRQWLISLGCEFMFETRLESIETRDNCLCGIYIKSKGEISYINTKYLVLATGHSARDTVRTLYSKGVNMIAKPFSMGVRVEHPQKDIDFARYQGVKKSLKAVLPPSDYKLSCHLPSGRSVYTFCMCPGGSVIGSASGKNQIVTNGMSYYRRNGENANSAVLVNVKPEDYHDDYINFPLSGIDFQEKWEKRAYEAGGSKGYAPCQYLGNLLDKFSSGNNSLAIPSYMPGVTEADARDFLPGFVFESIKEAFPLFEKQIKGFASPGAVITGIESRSSSPVRIIRDESHQSCVRGIFPCGEGAGYAGGIVSAAVDGIKTAHMVKTDLLRV